MNRSRLRATELVNAGGLGSGIIVARLLASMNTLGTLALNQGFHIHPG